MWVIRKIATCWRERRLPSVLVVQAIRFWRFVSPWQRRYSSEADFWKQHIAHIRHYDLDALRGVFPRELLEFSESFSESHGRPPEVLEIGSGPLSLLSWGASKGIIRVTAVDPLADVYRRIVRACQWDPIIKPRTGSGERLGRMFSPGQFDVAYASNALDHTRCPRSCLHQMVPLLRPGGRLIIEGYLKEGSSEQWAGLHQFDLMPAQAGLACHRKDGPSEILTEGLGLVYRTSRVLDSTVRGNGAEYLVRHGQQNWFVMVFEKCDER